MDLEFPTKYNKALDMNFKNEGSGYSRAVLMENFIFVSGTTALNLSGKRMGIGDPYLQTRQMIIIIKLASLNVSAGLKDLVRTRIFVKTVNHWEKIGNAHGEDFGEIRLATSRVEVNCLIGAEI